jgi:hypothetical protein
MDKEKVLDLQRLWFIPWRLVELGKEKNGGQYRDRTCDP